MGNNSSRTSRQGSFDRSDSISKPKALAAIADPDIKHDLSPSSSHYSGASHVSRHASAQVSHTPGYLGVSSANTHRRSRSAVAALNSRRNRESAPPPSYEAAVFGPGPSTLAVPQVTAARRRSFASPSNDGAPGGVPPLSAQERMEALRRPMRQHSVENALDTLRKYNTVIVVDDSGSMQGKRWKEVRAHSLSCRALDWY